MDTPNKTGQAKGEKRARRGSHNVIRDQMLFGICKRHVCGHAGFEFQIGVWHADLDTIHRCAAPFDGLHVARGKFGFVGYVHNRANEGLTWKGIN